MMDGTTHSARNEGLLEPGTDAAAIATPDVPRVTLYWEDFPVGETVKLCTKSVTKDEIISFAKEFDPQPFHLDERAAAKSMLGGLAASGWHNCAMMMRMMCDSYLLDSASMGSPGVKEVRWLEPIRPGDQITLRRTCRGKRPSASRPDMGVCQFFYEMLDQNNAIVMTCECTQFFERRNSGPVPVEMNGHPVDWSFANSPDVEPIRGEHIIKYFDDISIGDTLDLGSYKFTADRIKAFARAYDPQSFHLDEEAGRDSLFGGLCASGWHVSAVWMRQLARYVARETLKLRALRRPIPQLGVSPGFKDLRWHKPVYAGDTITYHGFASNKIELSRPDWGMLQTHSKGHNQDGELVFSQTVNAYMQRRPREKSA